MLVRNVSVCVFAAADGQQLVDFSGKNQSEGGPVQLGGIAFKVRTIINGF